jgi:hypothetical protein
MKMGPEMLRNLLDGKKIGIISVPIPSTQNNVQKANMGRWKEEANGADENKTKYYKMRREGIKWILGQSPWEKGSRLKSRLFSFLPNLEEATFLFPFWFPILRTMVVAHPSAFLNFRPDSFNFPPPTITPMKGAF